MIIVGAVHIAQSLIPMATNVGYEIVLIDPRSAFANPERFPNVDIDNRWLTAERRNRNIVPTLVPEAGSSTVTQENLTRTDFAEVRCVGCSCVTVSC